MIGHLRGTLILKSPPLLMLDVSGVGYEVEAPMTTFYALPEIGAEIHLYTHLVIREDAHSLFGFLDDADRQMFRLLIKVNGVGPKMALTILSGQTAEEFRRCILQNDTQTLVRSPGIGKKTAERLIIEMRDRLPGATTSSGATELNLYKSSDTPKNEAISALCSLGYKMADASRLVEGLNTDGKSCEELIRLALQGSMR